MTEPASSQVRIILASGSPRRRALVERLGIEPEVVVSDVVEEKRSRESPVEYTERLAAAKATDVAGRLAGEDGLPDFILAADTIVVFEGDVLEKPADAEEAREMIGAMAGEWHTVVTSFCWFDRRSREPHVETCQTDVRLRDLPDRWVRRYVETGEPFDKAGSYGIQDFGSLLVRELRGSYFNVVGLPVCEVVEMLETLEAFDVHPLLEEGDREAVLEQERNGDDTE